MYDATNISASKLVSISDLMKNNAGAMNHTQIKIDHELLDADEAKMNETMRQISKMSNFKEGRRTDEQTNKQRIMAMLRD